MFNIIIYSYAYHSFPPARTYNSFRVQQIVVSLFLLVLFMITYVNTLTNATKRSPRFPLKLIVRVTVTHHLECQCNTIRVTLAFPVWFFFYRRCAQKTENASSQTSKRWPSVRFCNTTKSWTSIYGKSTKFVKMLNKELLRVRNESRIWRWKMWRNFIKINIVLYMDTSISHHSDDRLRN